ncbi:MAG: hypothetical protein ACJASL_000109 [Paraglaciecola sp.]|jgi:hypothetical protein
MNKSFSKYKKASWWSIALSEPHKERDFKKRILKVQFSDPDVGADWLLEVGRHQGIKWNKTMLNNLDFIQKILKEMGE